MLRLLFLLTVLGLVFAEPDCSLSECIWKTDDYMFGDVLHIMEMAASSPRFTALKGFIAGGVFGHLQGHACKAKNWREYDNCLVKCPLALITTSPSNLTMRACLGDSKTVPFAPYAHIDSSHPLNEKELELVAMGEAGSADRQGCRSLNSTYSRNCTGKIVLVEWGTCDFVIKAKNVADAGGAAVVVVRLPGGSVFNPSGGTGSSEGIEGIPAFTLSRELGNLILGTIDAGVPVRGRLSLDCSVMSESPTGPLETCPSDLLFGICDDLPDPEDHLCSHCAVEMEIVGTGDSPCLYSHRLLPREGRNSIEVGAEEEVHLASLIPDFGPTCKDDPDFGEPNTGVTCADIANFMAAEAALMAQFDALGYLTDCLFLASVGIPVQLVPLFAFNCPVTCRVDDLACGGGTGEGCVATDFKNARGKIIAVEAPTLCTPFDMVRVAESMGVRGVVFLARSDNPLLLEGPSQFVSIPVHALNASGSQVLQEHATAAHKNNSMVTGVRVRVTATPPEPAHPPPPPGESPPETTMAVEASKDFTFTVPTIIALTLGVIFGVADCWMLARQHPNPMGVPEAEPAKKNKRGGFKLPLAAASTVLSLSLLFAIAVVAFSLAYAAGRETTDSVMDDGWAALQTTHLNAVVTVSQLKDQLMATVVGRAGQAVAGELNEAYVLSQTATKVFMTWDGTWRDFNRRLWQVSEMSRGITKWKVAIRTVNGFFAADLLKTDDRDNATRGDGYPLISVSNNGFLYGTSRLVYVRGGHVVRQDYSIPRDTWDPRTNLGRSWLDANARMKEAGYGSVVCVSAQQTTPAAIDVYGEFALRPLSCLCPIHDINYGFVGTVQVHTDMTFFGTDLAEAAKSNETANMTLIVFNELGELVTSSKGRSFRTLESYGEALGVGVVSAPDSVTVPIVLEYSYEPYLNAAANYMKTAMGLGRESGFDFGALQQSSGSGEFDQREWYGRGLWTRHVVFSMDFEG
eukprot:Hpha_TRINITY_DN4429_c0_g1::TRINITY_DN4429_c0_g1_i1::g.50413::m.50413